MAAMKRGASREGELARSGRKEEKAIEGEALRFGDSVTLFAEKMFGFLQGASGAAEEDEESSVFVRSLEHRHRPTGAACFVDATYGCACAAHRSAIHLPCSCQACSMPSSSSCIHRTTTRPKSSSRYRHRQGARGHLVPCS